MFIFGFNPKTLYSATFKNTGRVYLLIYFFVPQLHTYLHLSSEMRRPPPGQKNLLWKRVRDISQPERCWGREGPCRSRDSAPLPTAPRPLGGRRSRVGSGIQSSTDDKCISPPGGGTVLKTRRRRRGVSQYTNPPPPGCTPQEVRQAPFSAKAPPPPICAPQEALVCISVLKLPSRAVPHRRRRAVLEF